MRIPLGFRSSPAITATRRAFATRANEPAVGLNSQKGVLQFIDSEGGAGASRNGRSWRTSELRLKSYNDLHRLWFVLLKERNILLTEKEWCRSNSRHWVNGQSNLYKVKRSMARIKGVVGERLRALRAKQGREEMLKESAGGGGLSNALPDAPSEGKAGVVTRAT